MDVCDIYSFMPEVEIRRMVEKGTFLVRASNDFGEEVEELVYAAITDLIASGIKQDQDAMENSTICDKLIERAIMLYVKANFGYQDPQIYDRLQRAYEQLKAQLMTSSGYTDFGGGAADG